MILIRFCLVALALVSGNSAYSSPITYKVLRDHNADLAQLDWGYLTTDGTVGEGIHLGTILTDYRIKITEGPNSLILTPANSIVSADHIAFDITPDSITVPDKPTTGGIYDNFTVKTPGVSGTFSIQHSWRASIAEAWVYVTLDGVASAQEQLLPLIVATAIPEPATLTFAAMLTGWGIIGRRGN